MRHLIIALICMLTLRTTAQPLYIYSADGKTPACAPRELPSAAVRIDTRQTVLGLHGASAATRAACGWSSPMWRTASG